MNRLIICKTKSSTKIPLLEPNSHYLLLLIQIYILIGNIKNIKHSQTNNYSHLLTVCFCSLTFNIPIFNIILSFNETIITY